jgi:hypothetical protein
MNAAAQVYKPKNYTERDYLRGLLLWRLGGARLAGIANRMLGLPAVNSLRRHATIANLSPSVSRPTKAEVEKNLDACFADVADLVKKAKIVHQVLMVDELKVEERLRWDPATNCIVGLCREHSHGLPLEFKREHEPTIVFETLGKPDGPHLATEVSF